MDNPGPESRPNGTRFCYIPENGVHYQPFGSGPPRDLLEYVLNDWKEPPIAVLGCGDLRSLFYTIWKNFNPGFEQVFEGVEFLLNDKSPAIIARNVLFLYLCVKLPTDSVSRHNWLCAMWSIWFCYELLPNHELILREALRALLQLSENWDSPTNPLDSLVSFHTPQALIAIKQQWLLWQSNHASEQIKKQMKKQTQLNLNPFQRRKIADQATIGLFSVTGRLGQYLNQERGEQMKAEYEEYLMSGTVHVESLLGKVVSSNTTVNVTMFEKKDDPFVAPTLCPFGCFQQVLIASTSQMMGLGMNVTDSDQEHVDISSDSFKTCPLLANSFQQFSLWISCSAELFRSNQSFCAIVFSCEDVFDFFDSCCDEYLTIYALNMVDYYAAPTFILSATSFLYNKDGRLICSSKNIDFLIEEYIELVFGFPSKLLPVICGVRCINHEGNDYASPIPSEFRGFESPGIKMGQDNIFVWERTDHMTLVMNSLSDSIDICNALLKCFQACCEPTIESPVRTVCTDTAIRLVCEFAKSVHPNPAKNEHFWRPLCSDIKKARNLKSLLWSVQTRALIIGLHFHLTVDKTSCPYCNHTPLSGYLGQFRMIIPLEEVSKLVPFFFVFIGQIKLPVHPATLSTLRHRNNIIDCIEGSANFLSMKIEFVAPLEFIRQNCTFLLLENTLDSAEQNIHSANVCAKPLLSGNLRDYLVSGPLIPTPADPYELDPEWVSNADLGVVTKHIGNGDGYETIITLDKKKPVLLTSKIEAQLVQFDDNTLQSVVMVRCAGYSLQLEYPYPIVEEEVTCKRSRKDGTVKVGVKRRSHSIDIENRLFLTNPEDNFSLPAVTLSPSMYKFYCNLQLFMKRFVNSENLEVPIQIQSIIEMELVLKKILMTTDKLLFALTSKCCEDLLGLIEVANRVIDVNRRVPAIYLGYVFSDDISSDLGYSEMLELVQTHANKIEKIKLSTECFCHIITTILSRDTCAIRGDSFRKRAVFLKDGILGDSVKPAVLYPIYENPDKTVQFLKCSFCEESVGVYHTTCPSCLCVLYCSNECRKRDIVFHKSQCEKAKKEAEVNKSQENKKAKKLSLDSCAYCHKKSPDLKSCVKCRKAMYCGRECQRAHWKKHKHFCVPPVEGEKQFPKCSSCGKATSDLKKCTGCKKVSYCSKQCQTSHWSQHKSECKSSSKTNNSTTSSSLKSEQNKTKTIVAPTPNSQTLGADQKCDLNPNMANSVYAEQEVKQQICSVAQSSSSFTQLVSKNSECGYCGKMSVKPQRCGRCHKVFYCGLECQRAHWKEHKPTCTK